MELRVGIFGRFDYGTQIAWNTVASLVWVAAAVVLWLGTRQDTDIAGWRWVVVVLFSFSAGGDPLPLGALAILVVGTLELTRPPASASS